MKQLYLFVSILFSSKLLMSQQIDSYKISNLIFTQSLNDKLRYDILEANNQIGYYIIEKYNDDYYNLYNLKDSFVARLNFDDEEKNIAIIKSMNNFNRVSSSDEKTTYIPEGNLLKNPQRKYYYFKEPVKYEVLLYEGYSFDVYSKKYLSSKTIEEGDTIEFIIAKDYYVNGIHVFKEGTDVVAYVSDAERAGFIGKKGSLIVQLCYTWAIDGTKVKLRARNGKMEGNSKTGGSLALGVAISPLFLLKRGSNVKIDNGYTMRAYVLRDVILKPVE